MARMHNSPSQNVNGRDHLEHLNEKGTKSLEHILKKLGEGRHRNHSTQDMVQRQAPVNRTAEIRLSEKAERSSPAHEGLCSMEQLSYSRQSAG